MKGNHSYENSKRGRKRRGKKKTRIIKNESEGKNNNRTEGEAKKRTMKKKLMAKY